MDELWDKYRRNSKGWKHDPLAMVHPRIILGSCETIDLYILSTYNITHIVNCAEDSYGSKWFKDEFPDRYACINAIDDAKEDITKWYSDFEKVMNTFLSSKDCKNIYVHCQCGINRSAFLLLMYSCIKFGYTIETVAKNILLQRPCCFTNPSFRKQAIQYIKKHE
uniref:protein-serine/threonine phosphatase n=1 Tax=viral metagenome TaxID=1070528 RepID=A0A6C0EPG2_9ZZZZ